MMTNTHSARHRWHPVRLKLYLTLCLLPMLFCCTENIDTSARYVFTDETAISYLEKHSQFSEYVNLLHLVPISSVTETTLSQLLGARGHYTVFAPTNEAIQAYLDTLCTIGMIAEPSFSAFTDSAKLDSIRQVIVYNSIIDNGDTEDAYTTVDFPQKSGDEIQLPNLNDRNMTVYYGPEENAIRIFGQASVNIRNRDIRVLNGIIHQMDGAIVPRNITAHDYLQEIIDLGKGPYLVMARVLSECGLFDTLHAVRDEVYEQLYRQGDIPDLQNMTSAGFFEGTTAYVPEHRKHGFTIFAEKDDFWLSQGIDPAGEDLFEKLTQWILDNHQYSSEDRFTTTGSRSNPSHLLNQWVTYHILPSKIPANRLVIHHSEYGYNLETRKLGIPMVDYYATMGQPRLLMLYESRDSEGVRLNRFPQLDNGRNGTYQEITCQPSKAGCRVLTTDPEAVLSDIINCNIYPIDAPLAYTDEVRNDLMRRRIRYDGMSLFREAHTNNIRKVESSTDRHSYVYIPSNNVYQYFDGLWIDDQTHFVYYNAYRYNWCNLFSDEIKAVGRFDITFRLPPVPREGTYELRYGYNANANRGIVQPYFGTSPERLSVTGIPIDLRDYNGWQQWLGYETDTGDTIYNAEIDKRMRLHGFMKGPKSNCMLGNTNRTARDLTGTGYYPVRCLITRQHLRPDQTYYIRLKSVTDFEKKEFQLDYFEWCAKEIYDNPEYPEDIW